VPRAGVQGALADWLTTYHAHKDSLQQVSCFGVKAVWVFVLGMQHLLEGEVFGSPSKRWSARDELEEHAAKGPDIRPADCNISQNMASRCMTMQMVDSRRRRMLISQDLGTDILCRADE
jgi:hypothetical protein